MEEYITYQSDFRGKVLKCIESLGKGVVGLWALQTTTGKKTTVITEKESGVIVAVYLGQGGYNLPKVIKDRDEIDALGIKIGVKKW